MGTRTYESIRQTAGGVWRASTELGYFHAPTKEELRDKVNAARNGRCEALAKHGTGFSVCDRPLDNIGQCDRADTHV